MGRMQIHSLLPNRRTWTRTLCPLQWQYRQGCRILPSLRASMHVQGFVHYMRKQVTQQRCWPILDPPLPISKLSLHWSLADIHHLPQHGQGSNEVTFFTIRNLIAVEREIFVWNLISYRLFNVDNVLNLVLCKILCKNLKSAFYKSITCSCTIFFTVLNVSIGQGVVSVLHLSQTHAS